jgi:hypothetical protein
MRCARGYVIVLLLCAVGCSPAAAQREGERVSTPAATPAPAATSRTGPASAPAAGATSAREITINHITPRRDFVGPEPARFAWTAVDGADSYSIGVWSEVDVLMWRLNNIPGPSVERPAEVHFEPGTYFWAVSALRDEQQIADSGLAAFVVREP